MNEIATLIRYAGREVTQSILDVAKEQLVNNELLDEKEFQALTTIRDECEVWLKE